MSTRTATIDALKQTRDVIDQSTLDPEPFGFSSVFVFTEQFLVIYDELILNFVLALVAVAVLSLFILGDVAMVALICFTVVRRFFLILSNFMVAHVSYFYVHQPLCQRALERNTVNVRGDIL